MPHMHVHPHTGSFSTQTHITPASHVPFGLLYEDMVILEIDIKGNVIQGIFMYAYKGALLSVNSCYMVSPSYILLNSYGGYGKISAGFLFDKKKIKIKVT
ncbi:hypothetical protein XENOCAPTIV_009918 [Xenoophorus captivus]|uniref:Uncharacterized protein n=1 Tax=Xenoophorus captivus TaxID=1517983 RepID=A0ABV0QDP7_9TELE